MLLNCVLCCCSANVTIEMDTDEVRGFLYSAQAHLHWPSLVRKCHIKFPLTQIGNISVSFSFFLIKGLIFSLLEKRMKDDYIWDKLFTWQYTGLFVFISDIWFYCWKSWRYSCFNPNFTITTLSQPTDYHRSLI